MIENDIHLKKPLLVIEAPRDAIGTSHYTRSNNRGANFYNIGRVTHQIPSSIPSISQQEVSEEDQDLKKIEEL